MTDQCCFGANIRPIELWVCTFFRSNYRAPETPEINISTISCFDKRIVNFFVSLVSIEHLMKWRLHQKGKVHIFFFRFWDLKSRSVIQETLESRVPQD